MNKLVYLFNLIMLRTYKKKKKDKCFCCKTGWEDLNNIISKHNIVANKWNKIDKRIENKVLNEAEYYINGHGEKILIDNNHYLIQQVKIPAKHRPKLTKILEVAYYIGLFRATTNQVYLKKINYNKLKLDKITTYLNNYELKTLSNNIEDELIEKIKKYYVIE